MSKRDFTFQKRLNQIMTERKLYPSQLAKIVGIIRSLLYGYMQGDNQPTTFNLKKIALRLNISADWLLGISDNREIVRSGRTKK